jgi:hypothetical protein
MTFSCRDSVCLAKRFPVSEELYARIVFTVLCMSYTLIVVAAYCSQWLAVSLNYPDLRHSRPQSSLPVVFTSVDVRLFIRKLDSSSGSATAHSLPLLFKRCESIERSDLQPSWPVVTEPVLHDVSARTGSCDGLERNRENVATYTYVLRRWWGGGERTE